MITGDIGALLAATLRQAVTDGAVPPGAGALTASGSWRPAPPAAGGAPGTYSSSLPFSLAGLTSGEPAGSARLLAGRLDGQPGIHSAAVTGPGYLTITITDSALVALAARIALAGPGCARSEALAGRRHAAPPRRDLAAAQGWPQAWAWQRETVTARLAAAAGAAITPAGDLEPPGQPGHPSRAGQAVRAAPPGPVSEALRFAGAGAVCYALAAAPDPRSLHPDPAAWACQDLTHPQFAVRYAHAEAAATLRRAASLGFRRGPPAQIQPRLLADPAERALLDALSWLPERVAGAARRGRPHELTAHLERIAGRWAGCQDRCPALPYGGSRAARGAGMISARLWLADAVRGALAAGLGLLGLAAPGRL